MKPITREIMDRRQPAIRWSAVIAGTAVALGLWGVLQLLGVGAGLAAFDPRDAGQTRTAAISAGTWSVLIPLVAMFVGGYIAARLANTHERRIAGTHGLVVWGLTTLAGILASSWFVAMAARAATAFNDMADSEEVVTVTGKGLLALGAALVLSIASAIAGALLAVHGFRRHRKDTAPTTSPSPTTTTAPETPIVDASGAPLTPTTTTSTV